MEKVVLVVTSISKPNKVLRSLAEGASQNGWDFIMVGDLASPKDFRLKNCDYYDIPRQIKTGYKTAKKCLLRHYARKNIGYLRAIEKGAQIIVETDDDNLPLESFWQNRIRHKESILVKDKGWFNVYQHFSDKPIWPRGFPIRLIQQDYIKGTLKTSIDAPIQQGLANNNPDVDAIYRLCMPLPITFKNKENLALSSQVWCPFNSQNTTWWREAFPLLYLPSYCSFRMTDIWRSFIAQRIAWANGWSILFHKPTVSQIRNQHDLLKDLKAEMPGYLQNENIKDILCHIKIKSGREHIPAAMRSCYKELIKRSVFDPKEINTLDVWLEDLALITRG